MSMYWINDYIRENIAKEIEEIELPPEWRPYEVIRYVAKKVRSGQ